MRPCERVAADPDSVGVDGAVEGHQLIARSRRLLGRMHEEDREEAIDLTEQLEAAIGSGDTGVPRQASQALRELLFFVEAQG